MKYVPLKKVGIIILILFFSSCAVQEIETVSAVVKLGINLIQLFHECSSASNTLKEDVAEVNTVFVEGVNKNEAVIDLAKFWEKHWGLVHSDFDNLQSKLVETNNKSIEYFTALDRNNEKISNMNSDYKKKDLIENQELKYRYQTEYNNAVVGLEQSRTMLRQGDDFIYILRNVALRSELKNNIESLKLITVQADSLNLKIENFSRNCSKIFSANPTINTN